MEIQTGSFAGFLAGCLRGFFGKCSGRLRAFAKFSRRTPLYFPKESGRQQPQIGQEKRNDFPAKKGGNGQKTKFPYTVPNSEMLPPHHRIFVGSRESTKRNRKLPVKTSGRVNLRLPSMAFPIRKIKKVASVTCDFFTDQELVFIVVIY